MIRDRLSDHRWDGVSQRRWIRKRAYSWKHAVIDTFVVIVLGSFFAWMVLALAEVSLEEVVRQIWQAIP